jgi:dTDP-4-dehydrorhamnose reductase
VKALLLGAGGQLGRELVRCAPRHVQLTAWTRADLDLTDALLEPRVRAQDPEFILNAAAYTAVDRAEDEPERAYAINAAAPAALARAAAALGARLVQVSTDFVFDGAAGRPYAPDDLPAPLGVYGRSKRGGETAVLDTLGSRALVLRSAWVYAPHGHNFVLTVLRRLRERGEMAVVADQIGSPTFARGLAQALWGLVEREAGGVHHWTDAGVASWYDLAVAVQEEALGLGLLESAGTVRPIRTGEYPARAPRPPCAVLDKTATWTLLGAVAPHWRVSLRAMLRELPR